MFLKRRIKAHQELMVVGREVKTYVTESHYVVEFCDGIKLKLKFQIGKWHYPQEDIAYYENKLFYSVLKFLPNLSGKFDTAIISSYDDGLLHITLNINNKSLPRYFNIKTELEIESDKSLKVKYDELRNALIFYHKDKTLIIGFKSLELQNHIEIIKTQRGYKIDIYLRDHIKDEFNLDAIVSEDIDTYDAYTLEHKNIPVEKRVKMSEKKVEQVYNIFYTYLKNHKFRDILLSLYVSHLLNQKKINLPSKPPPSKFKYAKLLWEDLKKSKAPWIVSLEEDHKGSTLLHTLTLSNELIDRGEKEEAWKLLEHYSSTLIDYFLYKRYTLESVNLLYEILLFIRAFHKLFFNSINNHYSFYMPRNLMFLEIKNYAPFKKIEIINLHDNKYELSWKAYSNHSRQKYFVINIADNYGRVRTKILFKWVKKESYYISKGKQIISKY